MIEVLHNYGSIHLGNQRILPGVYPHDDPALHGLSAYLVANGHARVIGALPLSSVIVTDSNGDAEIIAGTVEEFAPDFDHMTKAELLDFIEQHQMEVDPTLNKNGLLEAVKTQWNTQSE